MWRSAAAGAAAALAVMVAPRGAAAFQIDTSTTSACHERITLDALDQAGWPDGAEPPPLDDTGERIAADVPFDLPGGSGDIWTIALLIGIRHNDVRALDPFDLPGLAVLHGDPDHQAEHCLRTLDEDGEGGDVLAIEHCRAFIYDQIDAALGDGDDIDMDATVEVETHLVFRGKIDLDLPAYPFHVGRALHALEDSYAHTFRNPTTGEIRSVLNWVEGNVRNGDPAVDGHAHVAQMDECGSGAGQVRRRGWATDAAADLLAALVSPEGGRDGRRARAQAVVEQRTAREPGCTAENDWCDTPEAKLSAGCAAGGGGAQAGWSILGLLGVVALGLRRRGGRARARPLGGLALVAALGAAPAAALAQSEPAPDADSDADQEREQQEEAAEQSDQAAEQTLQREEHVIERLPDPVSETWGAAFQLGAAFDRAAGAVSAGVRWNPWRDLGFGLDAEYNPWVSLSGFEVEAGAFSLYVPVIWRLKRFGTWELRMTGYAGASMILFDLVGVDKGTVGAFVGWNPLGLALPLGAHAKLVVKPGDIAVSAPQLRGIPFYYTQYRLTFGVEWYP